ncbi:FAD-dependent oxidoreductase [Streptomyces niveus]|uniref:FAD-dependent oxidoreductase n=1 Tax=Streptomyces niveus TaxID=193462 RepID=UPI003416787C
MYDMTDDRTPVYDRTDLDGFYVAIGTSSNQFKNAPLVARLTTTLIHGVEGGHDHDRSGLTHTYEHTGPRYVLTPPPTGLIHGNGPLTSVAGRQLFVRRGRATGGTATPSGQAGEVL